MEITPEMKKAAKARGFLYNRGRETFSARILTGNSVVTAAQSRVIADAAERFGNGNVSVTVRQTYELPGIPYEKLDELESYLGEHGLEVGGTGAKVRPVVCCKGTVCVFGLIDTQGLAQELHETFYKGWHDVALPHKFKLGVGGCPNSCAKPDLNDVGIVGSRPAKDGDPDATYRVFIGGRWGKARRMGNEVPGLMTHDEVIRFITRCLRFFIDRAEKGERFCVMLERVGVDEAMSLLLSDKYDVPVAGSK